MSVSKTKHAGAGQTYVQVPSLAEEGDFLTQLGGRRSCCAERREGIGEIRGHVRALNWSSDAQCENGSHGVREQESLNLGPHALADEVDRSAVADLFKRAGRSRASEQCALSICSVSSNKRISPAFEPRSPPLSSAPREASL